VSLKKVFLADQSKLHNSAIRKKFRNKIFLTFLSVKQTCCQISSTNSHKINSCNKLDILLAKIFDFFLLGQSKMTVEFRTDIIYFFILNAISTFSIHIKKDNKNNFFHFITEFKINAPFFTSCLFIKNLCFFIFLCTYFACTVFS
jgi:hypothetical protein